MSDPMSVLRRREELTSDVRKLRDTIKELGNVMNITLDCNGKKVTITNSFVCGAVNSCLLQPCLSKMEAELKEIEDRIAKWE